MQSITANAPNRQPLLWGVSLLLITTGLVVALSWLSPLLLAAIHPYAIQMAFNTGLGFIAAGLGLIAILYRQRSALLAICLSLALLGLLTLLDLLLGLPLNTVSWFEFMLHEPPLQHQPMSPTTATAFMLSGLALAAAGQRQGYASILACLLGVLIMFIALVGILGRGFDMLPRFTWLGIKMAPHTAAGFLLLGFGLIWICQTAAIQAFNRLRFFYRLLTGFVFMCLLFLFIGSLSMLQISSVASLTQQLYQQPLQIQNAAERINSQIALLNRELKNIAVAPERYPHQQIPALLDDSRAHIQADLQQIAQLSSSPVVAQLHSQFVNWQTQILDSYTAINSGDIAAYRNQLLQQIQQTAIALENLCSQLSQQAQHDMQNLELQANKAKQQAINLMSLVVCGLLLIGVAIAALITRSLNWQLDAIRTTMLAIAEDKHQVPIPFLEHPHEIGDMAKTLAIFARNNEERHNYAQILLQHQQDLEEINRRLSQTNKELETFAYVASHDLKSPLRGISQLSGWIEEDLSSGDTAELTKHTAMMRNRIARMEKLLDDLLVFYRAGKTDGNLSQVNLAQMAQELFDIHNNKPGLRLELGNNLPRFETLATPFEQVIRNLFSNAIKHHDRDTGIIRLSCNTLDNGFYQFQVCDDGPGIPEKFQERVFGMFQTLKPRDELEGSGMGLALIKKIVETYAGHISLHSAGRGCCFTFTWPQSLSPSQPAAQQKVNSHG